jgi:hypothetical protein
MLTWILLAGMLMLPQAGDTDFQPVANVNEIMTAMVIPSSNIVGNVGLDGEPTDEVWAETERQALILAESGNLLLMPSRSQGREPWISAAKDMVSAAESALDAARRKDIDPLQLDISGAIFDACTSCHDVYFN